MKTHKQKTGQAALTAVVLMLVIMLSAIFGASSVALKEAKVAEENKKSVSSFFAAESGLEDAVYRIKSGKNIGSSVTMALNNATVITTINTVGLSDKEIISSGDSSGAVRAIKAVVSNGEGAAFHYGVQVGYLGLYMENTSKIIGSVYSNGSITAKNSSQITGDAWVAGGTAFTPDQKQDQIPPDHDLFIRDIAARRDAAQSFIPSVTADIRKIALYIKKIGNPGDTDIKIRRDQNDHPSSSGISLATGHLNSSQVTSSFGWVEVTLNSNEPLLAGVKYWLLLDNGSYDAAKYYILGGADDSAYLNGTFKYSPDWNAGSPTWTETSRDAAFKIFLGTETTFIDGAIVGENGVGDAHANTIKDSAVAGSAYFQTLTNSTVGGSQFPGSLDPAPQNMPLSQGQIAEFKTDGDAGGTCGPPICDGFGNLEMDGQATTTLGPIKIPGNLRLDNKAGLIMTGTIHVIGTLSLTNSCTIMMNSAYGPTSGVIVVDGTVNIQNQCQLLGSGDPQSHLMVITTSPQLEGPVALHLKNSTAGAIFYASEGAMFLENQTDLKEAVAQKLRLKNQATVTYETGLANVQFSSGPTGGWQINNWQEILPQ